MCVVFGAFLKQGNFCVGKGNISVFGNSSVKRTFFMQCLCLPYVHYNIVVFFDCFSMHIALLKSILESRRRLLECTAPDR